MNKRKSFCTIFGSISFLIGGTLLLFAIHYIDTMDNTPEVAKVHCRITIEPSVQALRAQNECIREKREFEAGGLRQASGVPYPGNGSLEDFEWDDGCLNYCIYKRMGLLSEDLIVPNKYQQHDLSSREISSIRRHTGILLIWNECVELTVKTTFKRGFDICRTISYHAFCVSTKWQERESHPMMFC